MRFEVHGTAGPEAIEVDIRDLVVGGWTGRDRAALQAHMDELAELGVKAPSTVPLYYRCSASLVTQAARIQVIGTDSSGEVEAVLIGTEDGMLVTVGSDQTDRKVESYGVAVSKQLCAKVVAGEAWRYADVADHWDGLELICDRIVEGVEKRYQRGQLTATRRPEELIAGWTGGSPVLPPGTAMFLGTIPVIGHIEGAEGWRLALVDPARGRTITTSYTVESLPLVA